MRRVPGKKGCQKKRYLPSFPHSPIQPNLNVLYQKLISYSVVGSNLKIETS